MPALGGCRALYQFYVDLLPFCCCFWCYCCCWCCCPNPAHSSCQCHICSQEELSSLQSELAELERTSGVDEDEEERNSLIEKQYENDKAKLHKLKLSLVCIPQR